MIFRKSKENGVLQVAMTNFGASFKQARESKGISLDQIAAETRISTRFLSAIENEEFQLLPGGIFNRGFVRAFAEKVGLDPDQAVADYERLADVRAPEVVGTSQPAPARKERHLYPYALAVLALVIVIFYVVTRESGRTAQTASTPAPAPVATPQPAPRPAPAPATEPKSTATASENAPQTTAAAPEPEAVPLNALTLELDAHSTTWIKVVADGASVDPGEILQSGQTRKFTAQNSINLSVGNAGGLDLKLNDKPLRPLGKSGQVRELRITPDTAKDLIAP
jgi:cytoskeletal protein RodZ